MLESSGSERVELTLLDSSTCRDPIFISAVTSSSLVAEDCSSISSAWSAQLLVTGGFTELVTGRFSVVEAAVLLVAVVLELSAIGKLKGKTGRCININRD